MKKTLFTVLGLGIIVLSACNTDTSTSENGNTEVVQEVTQETAESRFLAYNEADYQAALAEGKDVFLDFHANWCAICLSNAPNIENAFNEVGDDNLIGFKVNFDTETALKKQFNIFSQSQLVMIPGGDLAKAETYPPGLFSKDKVLAIING